MASLKESALWHERPVSGETELKAVFAELCAALAPLHDRGEFHGRLCPSSFMVDDDGRLGLDTAAVLYAQSGDEPAQQENTGPLYGVLPDGYAAFEQYMDEPAWPQGPWTDVHALCALAHAFVSGEPPVHAVERMMQRLEIRFPDNARQDYTPSLLAAIQRGLSVDARLRQQSVRELAAGLGLTAQIAPQPASVGDSVAVLPVPSVPPVSSEAVNDDARPAGAKRSVPAWGRPALVLSLFAVGVAVWLLSGADAGLGAAAEQQPFETAAPREAPEKAEMNQLAQAPSIDDEQDALPPEVAALDDDSAYAHGQSDTADLNLPMDDLASEPASDQFEQQASSRAGVNAVSGLEDDLGNDVMELAMQTAPTAELLVANDSLAQEENADQPVPFEDQPQPAPSPSPINVAVDVQPWGEIFVNGVSRGVSPPLKQLSLPPGDYQIRIANGDLAPGEQRLRLETGEPAVIRHVFEE